MIKAAAYLRVSTGDQTVENQRPVVEAYCQQQDWQLTEVYAENESAWKEGHQKELARLIDDLQSGRRRYDRLIIVALDRLTRQGPGAVLRYMDTFKALKCQIVSIREPWTDSPFSEPMYLLIAWFANWESKSRSVRTKAGLARVLKTGVTSKGRKITQLGRPVGSKDKKPRRKAGYLQRYAGRNR
jgi:putative DNA-invertase from lambdoid prophage Rac